jgi:cytochrome c556
MSENTPKSKEEMEKALEDLQLDPDDLDAVVGGDTCSTCYSEYTVTPPVKEPETPAY